jgi:peptidyl-dipeptidase A
MSFIARLWKMMVGVGLVGAAVASCRNAPPPTTGPEPPATVTSFLTQANAKLLQLGLEASQAGWVQETYITVDTEAISARGNEAYTSAATAYAKQAARFGLTEGSPEERRQLAVLKNTITVAAPADAKDASELARILSSLNAAYGSGKYCPSPGSCLDVEAVTKILAENRDPARLREVWEGWHGVGAPMRDDYARFVELSNRGAREIGFADTGVMWRSRYDMPEDAFAREIDRLWEQLRPLYLSLHAFVRTRLHRKYGEAVPAEGPIPAHLLGNIWAQDWTNVYDLVAPAEGGRRVPLDKILADRKIAGAQTAKYGERFFVSLGFEPLPATFWERSLFAKPADRAVVCHPSAWNIDSDLDLRIKMCIDPTAEDFATVHHELGHNFYQRAYRTLPPILRDGANDGFHEAIGDTIALSVTPEYLVKVGLLDRAPDARAISVCCSIGRSKRSRSWPSGRSSTSGDGACSAAR